MGTGAISFCVAWLLVSPAVFSLTVLKVKFGDPVTLPCNGSAFRGSAGEQLDVSWKAPESVDVRKVAHYAHGKHSVGVHFSNRATFSMERITDGDYSLTIDPVVFSDEDLYECVWHPGQEDQVFLMDVRLYVLRPPVPKSISVHVNDSATLPCYSHLNKWAPQALTVEWKTASDSVLKFSSGQIAKSLTYERTASFFDDQIQYGNFSLSLKVTTPCDAGIYWCSSNTEQNATSVRLEIKDDGHFIPVNLTDGMALPLIFPGEGVTVVFSKEGTFSEVALCSRNRNGFECDPKYRLRTKRSNNTLTIQNMTSSDAGTYTVMNARNCTINRYRVNINNTDNHNSNDLKYLSFLIFIVPLIFVCVALIYNRKYLWRRLHLLIQFFRRPKERTIEEQQQMTPLRAVKEIVK